MAELVRGSAVWCACSCPTVSVYIAPPTLYTCIPPWLTPQCDRDLRRRIRKVPGVPLMYVVKHRYQIERLPDGGAAFV